MHHWWRHRVRNLPRLAQVPMLVLPIVASSGRLHRKRNFPSRCRVHPSKPKKSPLNANWIPTYVRSVRDRRTEINSTNRNVSSAARSAGEEVPYPHYIPLSRELFPKTPVFRYSSSILHRHVGEDVQACLGIPVAMFRVQILPKVPPPTKCSRSCCCCYCSKGGQSCRWRFNYDNRCQPEDGILWSVRSGIPPDLHWTAKCARWWVTDSVLSAFIRHFLF